MCSSNFAGESSLLFEKYLNSLLKLFKNRLGFLPVSVILFGSAVKGGFNSKISDVDFLIVLDDKIDEADRRAALSLTFALQKYFFKHTASSLLDRLLYFFETGTGMFKSFFICFQRDLLSLCFHRIFNVNKVLSWFMAPEKLILNSIFSNCRVVYGRKYDFKHFIKDFNFLQLVKSFILCTLLYLVFIILYCFKPVWRYFYESIKWSLLNCYFYLTKRSVNVKEALIFFKKLLDKDILFIFESYRSGGFNFNLQDLFKFFKLIFDIHFKAPFILSNRFKKN